MREFDLCPCSCISASQLVISLHNHYRRLVHAVVPQFPSIVRPRCGVRFSAAIRSTQFNSAAVQLSSWHSTQTFFRSIEFGPIATAAVVPAAGIARIFEFLGKRLRSPARICMKLWIPTRVLYTLLLALICKVSFGQFFY